jgi:hypothetical protein
MGISTVVALPKSQPDISKLNTFTGYVVSVTKHLGPRGTVGTAVVASKTMTKDQVLALQEQLPQQHGPGFYNFSVSDAGGTGDDVWLVKLGQDVPQQQEYPMAGANGVPPMMGGAPGAPAVLSEGVRQIGPGYYYDENLGTLVTPWREIVQWRPGEALPKAPTNGPASHLSLVPPPNASPWGQQPWGGFPTNDDSSKVKELQAQIAEGNRQREMDRMRDEARRAQEDTNKRIDEQMRMTREMFENITKALTAKPSGPSDELRAVLAQNEKLERQMESDRRDAAARETAAQTREEMRRQKEDTDRMIREMSVNKSDPMLTMIMQVMQQSNASAMEAVKAIQASTGAATTAQERSTQQLVQQLQGTITTPMQMMQMMSGAKSEGADMARALLDGTKDMMALQKSVFEQLLDVAGNGGAPPWLQAVQVAMDKIGPIGEAMMQARAKPAQVIVRERVVTTPPPPQAAALSGAPGVAPAPGPTRAQFKPGGGAPVAEVVNGTPLPNGTLTNPPKKKRKKGDKADDAPVVTMENLRETDPDEVAEAVKPFGDADFFGPILPHIKMLRDQIKSGLKPEQAAEMLLRSRPNLMTLSPMPPAVELMIAEQIEVLVDRIMPDADDDYRESVTNTIEAQLDAEQNAAEE